MKKYLKKSGSTRVFPYSDQLARRSDMLLCTRHGSLIDSRGENLKEMSSELDTLRAQREDYKSCLERALAEKELLAERLSHLEDRLLALGGSLDEVVVPASDSETEVTDAIPDGKEAESAGAATLEEVVEAISLLDRQDKKSFTGTGLPRIEVLEELTGKSIDMALRDAAWEQAKAGE